MKKIVFLFLTFSYLHAIELDNLESEPDTSHLIRIAEIDDTVIFKTPDGSEVYCAHRLMIGTIEILSNLLEVSRLLHNPKPAQDFIDHDH